MSELLLNSQELVVNCIHFLDEPSDKVERVRNSKREGFNRKKDKTI